jgi:putative holliday junction resolvase
LKITLDGDIIGLDLGTVRTGVARINTIAKIAEPLTPITMSNIFVDDVKNLVSNTDARAVVVGLPRGLDGQITDQTLWAKEIFMDLKRALEVPVFAIDEAATTKQAEQRANAGQSVDSVAAGVFLEDFVQQVGRGENASVSI